MECKHKTVKIIIEGEAETTSSGGYWITRPVKWCKTCGAINDGDLWTLPKNEKKATAKKKAKRRKDSNPIPGYPVKYPSLNEVNMTNWMYPAYNPDPPKKL
jgi:hypothetical protein